MKNHRIGDLATPKDYPELASKVKEITTLYGERIYILENGGRYLRSELKSIKEIAKERAANYMRLKDAHLDK